MNNRNKIGLLCFVIVTLIFISMTVIADISLSQCENLTQADTIYTLQTDITGISGTCFRIQANGITLDFNGYNITGDDIGSDYGVYNSGYNDSIIKDGYISDFFGGIYLLNNQNNNITNMISNSNGEPGMGMHGYGIHLYHNSNNTIQDCITNSNGWGITLEISHNNTIQNNIANLNAYYNILLGSNSHNNNITSNDIWNCLGTLSGCILVDGHSNIFTDNKINLSDGHGIKVECDSNHNVFKNTNMTNVAGTSVWIMGSSTNNTFLNFTYNNESVESGSELIRKWYYKAYVNESDTGASIEDANVTAYNTTGIYQFNLTTDDTGYTPLGEIIDYVNDGDTVSYYSNYTIYAQSASYDLLSHTRNITLLTNQYKDVFSLVEDLINPEIKIIYPPNNTNSSDNTLNVNYTVSNINLDSCWYSNDSYSGNITITCGNNITGITWIDGQHNLTIWVNDTSNNVNSSSVTFMIDTIYPQLNITTPYENDIFTTSGSSYNTTINYTVNDVNLETCWYNITYSNGDTIPTINTTIITSCNNISFRTTHLNYDFNLTLCANDSTNNINCSHRYFEINYKQSEGAGPGGGENGNGGGDVSRISTLLESINLTCPEECKINTQNKIKLLIYDKNDEKYDPEIVIFDITSLSNLTIKKSSTIRLSIGEYAKSFIAKTYVEGEDNLINIDVTVVDKWKELNASCSIKVIPQPKFERVKDKLGGLYEFLKTYWLYTIFAFILLIICIFIIVFIIRMR